MSAAIHMSGEFLPFDMILIKMKLINEFKDSYSIILRRRLMREIRGEFIVPTFHSYDHDNDDCTQTCTICTKEPCPNCFVYRKNPLIGNGLRAMCCEYRKPKSWVMMTYIDFINYKTRSSEICYDEIDARSILEDCIFLIKRTAQEQPYNIR